MHAFLKKKKIIKEILSGQHDGTYDLHCASPGQPSLPESSTQPPMAVPSTQPLLTPFSTDIRLSMSSIQLLLPEPSTQPLLTLPSNEPRLSVPSIQLPLNQLSHPPDPLFPEDVQLALSFVPRSQSLLLMNKRYQFHKSCDNTSEDLWTSMFFLI